MTILKVFSLVCLVVSVVLWALLFAGVVHAHRGVLCGLLS